MMCPLEKASLWPRSKTNAIQRMPETRSTFRLQEEVQIISGTVRSAVKRTRPMSRGLKLNRKED